MAPAQSAGRAYNSGSQIITSTPPDNGGGNPVEQPPPVAGVLRLRGAAPRNAPRVKWEEDTVDNEGLGRKKSKMCCIYHKPKAFDESSSSDSDTDSDASTCSSSPSDVDERNAKVVSDNQSEASYDIVDRTDAASSSSTQAHASSCSHRSDGHKRKKGKSKHSHRHRSSATQTIPQDKPNKYEQQPGSGKGKKAG